MRLTVPSRPDNLGEACRIVAIDLVDPHRERCLGMAWVDVDHRQPTGTQLVMQPD
jgi:hypothetical protein